MQPERCRTACIDDSLVRCHHLPDGFDSCPEDDGVELVSAGPGSPGSQTRTTVPEVKMSRRAIPGVHSRGSVGAVSPRILSDRSSRFVRGYRRNRPGGTDWQRTNARTSSPGTSWSASSGRSPKSQSGRYRPDPPVARAQEDAAGGKMVDLRDELHPYESLNASASAPKRMEVVSEPPKTLIGAHLAREWVRRNWRS